MKIFDNLFNINIQKLFLQGRIEQAYEKMYNVAHNLAAEELRKNLEIIDIKLRKDKNLQGAEYMDRFLEKIASFKSKRIEYHMREMKELLKLREQLKEDKK